MAGKTVAEVLAEKREARMGDAAQWRKIGEFVNQTLSFVKIEEVPSKFPQTQLEITALTEEVEEVVIRTSSAGIVENLQALAAEGLFPIDLKVVAYPSNYGKDGYDLEEV
jgi:hypothetical protein